VTVPPVSRSIATDWLPVALTIPLLTIATPVTLGDS
jgi:hypothetical protein